MNFPSNVRRSWSCFRAHVLHSMATDRGCCGVCVRVTGQWRGGAVAVKVISHDATLSRKVDTLRESLVGISMQHPNVVRPHPSFPIPSLLNISTCHKFCTLLHDVCFQGFRGFSLSVNTDAKPWNAVHACKRVPASDDLQMVVTSKARLRQHWAPLSPVHACMHARMHSRS